MPPPPTINIPSAPARFPLPLCVTALILNGLALSAAVIGGTGGGGIQWGAAPAENPAAALSFAWVYVHLMIAAGWFLLWPAFALSERRRTALPWDLAALALAALPAAGVAAALSEVPWPLAARMLLLQAAFAAVVAALLARRRNRTQNALLAGVLSLAYLALPALAYIQREFLPTLTIPWESFAPALTIVAASAPQVTSTFWWTPITCALLSAALFALPRSKPTIVN